MPPVQIPTATKLVTMKQYKIPWGHEEISQTIKDLLDAGVLKSATTDWNNSFGPIKKSDGSWRMTVDFKELNKYIPPLRVAVPDIVALIEKTQKHSRTWYAVIDLSNAFFTIPVPEEHWDQFALTCQGRWYTYTRLPQGWLHSPTICH